MTAKIPAGLREPLLEIAREAGAIIRDRWNKPRTINYKGRIDIVTDTDVAVEDFLRERLGKLLPEAAFVGEEGSSGLRKGHELEHAGDLAWVVDPLDGTTNFAHQLPFVATSIGLLQEGKVRLGVIYNSIMEEFFWAEEGSGAYCNDEPLRVSTASELERCVAATGFPYSIRENIDPIMLCLQTTLTHCRAMRRYGAAALDLAYVAWGRLDFFYEGFLHPWDSAAGWLLVEEAGGRVTQLDASQAYFLEAPTLLASNGLVHEAISSLLRDKGLGEAVRREREGKQDCD